MLTSRLDASQVWTRSLLHATDGDGWIVQASSRVKSRQLEFL